MNVRRKHLGAETAEFGLLAVILLCLSIGAVTIFGGQLQKVFQSEDSPVVVSAVKMQNSSDPNDPNGTNSRTNLDKSLVTTKLISKAYTDTSIGSSVGQETTGATGGDAAIGGTYVVTNQDHLYDGDPTTTGNDFLDAALAAKRAALNLLNGSISAETMANLLEDQANKLLDKAVQQDAFLSELEQGLDALTDTANEVDAHLQLLLDLKAAAQDIEANVAAALNYTDQINLDILTQTGLNLAEGQALLDLNQDQIAAEALYNQLQADYDAGWTTQCDPEGVCTDVNVSGITLNQISSQLAQSNQLLAEVNGQAAGIGITINQLENAISSLNTQADAAWDLAEDMQDAGEDLIKSAFKHGDHLFEHCDTVQEMIEKAEWALGTGGHGVKDYQAAYEAINYLKQSAAAYETAKKLDADAQQAQNHLDDQQETLSQLNTDALNLSLQASQQATNDIIAAQDASLAAIAAADPEIAAVNKELGKVQSAAIDAANSVNAQQSLVNTLNSEAQNVLGQADAAHASATQLSADAQAAVDAANETIDDLVCYPEEEPCT